jgi:hypothetical protein
MSLNANDANGTNLANVLILMREIRAKYHPDNQ